MNMILPLRYLLWIAVIDVAWFAPGLAVEPSTLWKPHVIESSWDDLTEGLETPVQWQQKRRILKKRFLELIRDQFKPERVPLELKIHESVVVDQKYTRRLISYQVEIDERAHAYLGIPLELPSKAAAIVALHGTFAEGAQRAAGLVDNPDKAYLDHLCRRGYVVIAPEHFVSGHRLPQEGAYDTEAFYKKHPDWTAVGKSTWEHSIAIDVLTELKEVDPQRIGALGHSLGGQGAIFLAAYDERIKVAACNCSAPPFRHNPEVLSWARDRWYSYIKHARPGMLRGELPPIDFHEIMALIAPRAFLDVSAINDGNSEVQRQRVLMLMSVMKIYQLSKVPENFAFFIHGRGHSVSHESRQLLYGWMDTHLLPLAATATRRVTQP